MIGEREIELRALINRVTVSALGLVCPAGLVWFREASVLSFRALVKACETLICNHRLIFTPALIIITADDDH